MTTKETQIAYQARMLSLTDVRDLSGLGMTKIHELIATGELPSVKVGSRRLVPGFAYETWVSTLLEEQMAK